MIGGRAATRRRARGPVLLRAVLLLLGALLVFALGVGFGQALEENETGGAATTYVRTLTPERVPPVARTVTVTVTAG